MILSLFSHFAALVPLMLSPLIVHLLIPRWIQVNNRSFRHASPRLWKKLLKELRQPVDNESLSLSSHFSLTSSSSSLLLCITPSLFHSRLKSYLFHIFSHHSLPHLFNDHFRTKTRLFLIRLWIARWILVLSFPFPTAGRCTNSI